MRRTLWRRKPSWKPVIATKLPRGKKIKLKTIKSLRNACDALIQQIGKLKWPRSEVSGQPTQVIHHINPKSVSNALRYDWDNLVALTNGEHMRHHQAGDPLIHGTIIFKRGQEWWDKLLKRRYREFVKTDRVYYETIKDRLEKELSSLTT
jgi:hypothetical protein